MTFEVVLFFLAGAVALFSAVMMITRPNPLKGVLFLIVNFFCLALLYLILQAQFIAIIQILVYAGAIMVLFVFVIMLLNLDDEKLLTDRRGFKRSFAVLLGAGLLAQILATLALHTPGATAPGGDAGLGTVEAIGKVLYTDFVFPFEVTSVLLLAALIGVVVLAKRRFM